MIQLEKEDQYMEGGGIMGKIRGIISTIFLFLIFTSIVCIIISLGLYIGGIHLNQYIDIGRWIASVIIVLFSLRRKYLVIN